MMRHPIDIVDAVRNGRVHQQRFFKNTNFGTDAQWWDWAFASGLPGYDARIGIGSTLNPVVATRNDAIYFPAIPAGMQRQLAGVHFAPRPSGASQLGITVEVYDLLAVYPLIDGDSTDLQSFDNTLTLPRYEDGDGVVPILVNHVAPMLAAAGGTYTYTDSDGNTKSSTFRAALTGQNRVVDAIPTLGGAGPLGMPFASGGKGARNIQSLIFDTAPGGLFCIYLVRLLGTIVHYEDAVGALGTNKVGLDYCFCIQNGWDLPEVFDGAHIGMFVMNNAGSRTDTLFGHFTFVWG